MESNNEIKPNYSEYLSDMNLQNCLLGIPTI